MTDEARIKLGAVVTCTAYIKPSGNHFDIFNGKYPEARYHENGFDESVEIKDDTTCDRYTRIEKVFTGIYVGTTRLCTKLTCESWSDYDCDEELEGYRCRLHEPRQFAIVYYASNKKRLVPIDDVKEVQDG